MLFLAKDLCASRVNLLMNDFAAGLPSPLAFLGLGAAIAPQLGAPRWDVAVLPVLHRVGVSPGRTKAEFAPHRTAGVFAPIEIPEDLVGSVKVSVLLDIPGCDDEHAVATALLGRRIAGGVIANERIIVERVTADDTALNGSSRGYAMVPAHPSDSHLVATRDLDDLKRLAARLFPAERAPGSGWHVPVAVGHRLLEDPATVPRRRNTRDPAIPHVFTEPAVGIAELVAVRSKRMKERFSGGLDALLWRWVADGDWIVGHRAYHPDTRTSAQQEDDHAKEAQRG